MAENSVSIEAFDELLDAANDRLRTRAARKAELLVQVESLWGKVQEEEHKIDAEVNEIISARPVRQPTVSAQ